MEDIKFNIGDTVRHKYTKEVLEITEFGTGSGKVSIGCVNATKSEWELITYQKKGANIMKLSDKQLETIYSIGQKPSYGNKNHHPKDRFNLNTLNSLEKKDLVEFYNYHGFLHGAVRLTSEGLKFIV